METVKTDAEIVSAALTLRMLTAEYVIYKTERPLIQWHLQYDRLGKLLKTGSAFGGAEKIDGIKENYEDVNSLFSKMVTDQFLIAKGGDTTSDTQNGREDKVKSILFQKLQSMISDASEIHLVNQSATAHNLRMLNNLIIAAIAGEICLLLINFYLLSRKIIEPLNRLAKKTELAGNGEQDEIECISAQIGEMQNALKEYGRILENETAVKRKMEQALEQQNHEIARRSNDLEHFSYIASHNLQEPLRNIASCMQLLQRRYCGSLGKDAEEFVQYAIESAVRMKALVNDLLEYSRIGTRRYNFRPVNCNTAVRCAIDNLKQEISQSGAVITADPLPVFNGDDAQITQLFQSILSNSIKFNGESHPVIHISAAREGNELVFVVSDNGMGIESGYLDKIFRIFQKLHSNADYPGTGIGLAMAKRIVERHGGRIWAESEVGVGTRLFFTIPVNGVGNGGNGQDC